MWYTREWEGGYIPRGVQYPPWYLVVYTTHHATRGTPLPCYPGYTSPCYPGGISVSVNPGGISVSVNPGGISLMYPGWYTSHVPGWYIPLMYPGWYIRLWYPGGISVYGTRVVYPRTEVRLWENMPVLRPVFGRICPSYAQNGVLSARFMPRMVSFLHRFGQER